MVYVSKQICGTIWGQTEQLGESGEYWMKRVRQVCFHVRSSECSSPCMCRLRTVPVGPWGISIDYVLAHMGFMGSRKLSTFDGRWVGWYPTLLNECTLGLCMGHPRMPIEVSHGRHELRWGRIQTDSLIVIVKGGHSRCLCDSHVSCCQVIFLAMCILIRISEAPSDMGEACSQCLNVVMELHYCWYENYDDVSMTL
jgi:hypothetical protein